MKAKLLAIVLVMLMAATLAAANIVFASGRFRDHETSTTVFTAISGWLDFAWSWRRPINITSTGYALNDYQLGITVDTASLIAAGKMQPEGEDLRFTDANGTTLIAYWIDSGINTVSTVIWIKVPLIPLGDSMIYMYYGNPSAPAASSGGSTFIFFDDFETDFIPGINWNVVNPNAGSVSLSTNRVFQGANSLRVTDSPNGNSLGVYADFLSQTSCVIECAIFVGFQGSKEIRILDPIGNIGPQGGFSKSKAGTDTLEFYSTDWIAIGSFPASVWYQTKIVIPDTTTATDYYSVEFLSSAGDLLAEAHDIGFKDSADLNSLSRFLYIGTSDSRTDTYLDLVKVRSYAAIEPIYSVGNEQ